MTSLRLLARHSSPHGSVARLLVLATMLSGCSTKEDDPAKNGTPSGGQGGTGAGTGGAVGKAGAASGQGGSAAVSATGGTAGGGATTTGAGSGSLGGGSGGQGGSSGGKPAGTGGNAGGVDGGASGGGSAGLPAGGQGGSAGASTVPAVHFVGRVDDSDPENARFAWSGTGVVARFEGTQVSALLGGSQQFTVVVDGEVQPKLTAQNGTNALASGLAAGEHTVELYRRTEASLGVATFMGFDFGGGTLLAPPAPARRLEFVGDSITCGYGDEGPDMNCGFSAETENHYLAYPALTARSLQAELSTVAWSGKGVVCNYGDAADSCQNPLPTYYDRTLPDDGASRWDFSRFVPDAVVVNLGTNDFSTTDDPSKEEFESAYRTLLERIRSAYPNAYVLCTNGPMLSGTELSTAMGYIDNVVAALGDPKISTFDITPQDGTDGYGCDWHPSLARHEKVAAVVTAELKTKLGW